MQRKLHEGSVAAAVEGLSAVQRGRLHRRLGSGTLREFLSLSAEADPDLFLEGFFSAARRLEGEGRFQESAAAYGLLASAAGDRPQGRRARARLDAMSGRGSFGDRAEFLLGTQGLDYAAGGVSHAGAVLGLATIFCSYLRPLRPLAAGGVQILSHPGVAGALLASGGYLLVRQAPEAWAAGGRLLFGSEDGRPYSTFEDVLTVSGFAIGALGVGVGVTSFGMGARTFLSSRDAALAQGFGRSEAVAVAAMRADAVRRAVNDPEIWIQFARSQPGLSVWQRGLLSQGGLWTSRSLLYGSAAVGLGRFGLGMERYLSGTSTGDATAHHPGLASLLFGLALDLSPAVTVHLYRAGRGDRDFHLGPALSQELTERHYQDPALRQIVLERLRRGVPPLSPVAERAFIRQANVDLLQVERLLRRAQKLSPLTFSAGRSERTEVFGGAAAALPETQPPVAFGAEARWPRAEQRSDLAGYDLAGLRLAYAEGRLSPVGALRALVEHPAAGDGAVFPRSLDRGRLHDRLFALAEESHRRFEQGRARPLEGVLVAVKDLFPGVDGQMQLGSKTARVAGVEASPVVATLLEMGAIPVPVGMVAAASGGSGQNAGFGYVPHPRRPGFDPAGSSSATAHVVGRDDLPIAVGIGTDTGGSVSAPAGAVGVFGLVPPAGVISTRNMVPFATFLDRVGVMARAPRDAMTLARYLSRVAGEDPHQRLQNPGELYQASPTRPALVYLESLVAQASPEARVHFLQSVEAHRRQGFEVRSLGTEWDFLAEAPLLLYPFDAYVAGVFTHTNPLQRQRFDPPRRVLDENLAVRLPKGGLSLSLGFYDQARGLSQRYLELVRGKLGQGVVLVSPAAEAISTAELAAGRASPRLDGHDRITMAKNRIPEWGQMTLPAEGSPEVGLSFAGALPDLMHFTGEARPLAWRLRDLARPARSLPLAPWLRPVAPAEELPAPPRAARTASLQSASP
ncbi:MAG: hypothetical protein IT572_08295 [Deltaproteobacteria bacterium]|nr:hypothetical protein [Deltaproteobacteria bacterium]